MDVVTARKLTRENEIQEIFHAIKLRVNSGRYEAAVKVLKSSADDLAIHFTNLGYRVKLGSYFGDCAITGAPIIYIYISW